MQIEIYKPELDWGPTRLNAKFGDAHTKGFS